MMQALAISSLFPTYRDGVKTVYIDKKIERRVEKLVDLIIKSRKSFRKSIQDLLPEIFDLRIELVKWVVRKGIDFRKNARKLLIELEKVKGEVHTQSESILIENVLFSLRTVIKVVNSILTQYPLSKQEFEKIDIHMSKQRWR